MRGVFITFEGCDGSGKSTQVKILADRLQKEGRKVVLTREPGGTVGGEHIRALLTKGDADRWSAETELLLFNAARRDHIEKIIQPGLERGAIVICDRYVDSTRAYQTVQNPHMRAMVDFLHTRMIGLDPDLTLVLDKSAASSLGQANLRQTDETRFEAKGERFQTAVRHAYLALYREFPNRVKIVQAGGSIEDVAQSVYEKFKIFAKTTR